MVFSHCFRCFRIVFAVFALFSQSDCLSFWGLRKDAKGAKLDEIWLAAREGVGLAARVLVCSLRELRVLCHTEITEITEICSLREQGVASILYSTLITVNWTCNCSLMLSSVFDDNRIRGMLRCR